MKKKTEVDFFSSDDALFHYTNRINGIDYILSSGYLRLSSFCKTSDPLEYKNWMLGISGGLQGSDHNVFFNLEDKYNEIVKKKTYFLSFCENKLNNKNISLGFNRSRMWSQYGENHKGICLIFSKKELLKSINNENTEKCIVALRSVRYKSNLPLKGILFTQKMLKDEDITKSVMNFINTNINSIYFTKLADYISENECRLVIVDPSELNEYKYLEIVKSIRGIILGDNLPDLYIPMFKEIRDLFKINIFKANYRNDQMFLRDI